MTEQEYSSAVSTARDYYNSSDADNFYFTIWGGEDIHIGLYETPESDIFESSRKTVEKMASKLPEMGTDGKIIDLGSGYGGAARYLAKEKDCRVVALNLSEVENNRNRNMNEEQGVGDKIEVIDGSFEKIPFPDTHFNAVWSQDAILHSGERAKVVSEAARVLQPGGRFVFTDPMMSDDCPDGVLQPILDRIHLEDLGCPSFYRKAAEANGLKEIEFIEMTDQLITHYSRVLQETEKRENELDGVVSDEYIANMKKGLQHWIDGGIKGYLSWGIFVFEK